MAPRDVAEWMIQELQQQECLYQDVVVYDIESKFGNDFVYINDNGNLAIDKQVLKEFRSLTEDTVVWERGARYWRKREDYDKKGQRQAD